MQLGQQFEWMNGGTIPAPAEPGSRQPDFWIPSGSRLPKASFARLAHQAVATEQKWEALAWAVMATAAGVALHLSLG